MKNYAAIVLALCLSICLPALATDARSDAFRTLRDNSNLRFEHHIDTDPKSFKNALALNVFYPPIKNFRPVIEKKIGKPLKFLTAWKAEGEAHVTVITPPEFVNTLRHHLTMDRIHKIALEHQIQKADMKVLGIGSGTKKLDGIPQETFFVIVDSERLRKTRYAIYLEFIANGGKPTDFDPASFYPHITIGYTERDLHESDGIIKNIQHGLDARFGFLNLSEINSR